MPRKAERGRKRSRARARKSPQRKRRSARRPSVGRLSKSAKIGPNRKRGRRSSISSKIRSTERAISALGEKNVKRGSLPLGQTRKLTPTRQGFRAVRRTLDAVAKATKRKRRTFTYDIEGTYKGADGKIHHFSRKQVGIPRLRDIRRQPGESETDALARTVEMRIRIEVQGILRDRLGGYSIVKGYEEKISKKEAEARLRALKKSRDVRFRLTFRREVA